MKKFGIAVLLLATALLLCACGAPQSEEETPPAKQAAFPLHSGVRSRRKGAAQSPITAQQYQISS